MAHFVQSLISVPTFSKHRVLRPNLMYSIHKAIRFTVFGLLLSTQWEKCFATNVSECFGTTSIAHSDYAKTPITDTTNSCFSDTRLPISATVQYTLASTPNSSVQESTQSSVSIIVQSFTSTPNSSVQESTQSSVSIIVQSSFTSTPNSSGQGTSFFLPSTTPSEYFHSTSDISQVTATLQMMNSSSSTQGVNMSSNTQGVNASSTAEGVNESSTTTSYIILPTTYEESSTTATTALTTPFGCGNGAMSCASSTSYPSTSTLYSTVKSQATPALLIISEIQSSMPAVSIPTTEAPRDQTDTPNIAVATSVFLAISCTVIVGISLTLIIGISLAFIVHTQSTRATRHRQGVKAKDEFQYVNENHCVSEDIRTPHIETSFAIELSHEDDETETSSLEDPSTFQRPAEPSGGPIHVANFQQYVMDLHRERNVKLEVHFRALEAYSLSLSANKHHVCSGHGSKDRYTNILPYIHSRVKLTQGPGLDDYINASYIDGYNQKDRYIAAQGPIKNTLEDFWRMMWECSIDIIVMLTKCYENGQSKCEQYWAGRVGESFKAGLFTIVTASSVHLLDYDIRTLVLTNSNDPNSKPRKLTHYHYTSWPDHGVPQNTSSMVGFVRQIQRAHARNEGAPLVVNCSAGVGRTGTFIVLDSMFKRITCEGTVDVYGFLKHIRSQRCLLVQTLDQYSFIYDVLNDFIICGDTEIAACDLKLKVKEMQTPVTGQTINSFQKQFELLNHLSSKRTEDNASDKEDRLAKTEEITTVATISFINGFQQRSAYMAVQTPDEDRRSSFWNAIWRHQVRILVVLDRVQHIYWPQEEGQSITCDKLEVQHQSTCTQDGGIVKRNLKIVTESSVIDVVQLELTEWPAEPSTMIRLLEAVTKTQLTTPTNSITVLSSDGVAGGAGMFVTLHCELEHLKAEGTVDVFQRVKVCREQCPAFLMNEEQYEYCHLVLADFVDSMSEYANFT